MLSSAASVSLASTEKETTPAFLATAINPESIITADSTFRKATATATATAPTQTGALSFGRVPPDLAYPSFDRDGGGYSIYSRCTMRQPRAVHARHTTSIPHTPWRRQYAHMCASWQHLRFHGQPRR